MSDLISAEENRIEYAKKKDAIINLLNETVEFYESQDLDSTETVNNAQAFKQLIYDLEKDEFNIVVIGEFSAGKSTLLNALMGERILPSFTEETTATVNFLRHKERSVNGEAGIVYYRDGTTDTIDDLSLKNIEKYVSTRGDDVAKNVEHLDLFLDSKFLEDGVTLVDSPGLNGLREGHREITEQQILQSHACIFLFNSDHPGSKTDFDFLHEVKGKVNTILFVLNKIDAIKESENESVESVINSLKKNYKKECPEETSIPEIWPVSAYKALVARNKEPLEFHDKNDWSEAEKSKLELESRLKDFENRLMNFLTKGEKTRQQLMAPIERVISVAKQSREKLLENKEILNSKTDTDEIQKQIDAISDSIKELEKQIISSRSDIEKEINIALREITENLSAGILKYQDKRLLEIESFDDLDELCDYIQSFESNFIHRITSLTMDSENELRDKIISVVRLRSQTELLSLEEKLGAVVTDIKLDVREHLDSSDVGVFEVGLDKMNEKTQQLEDELHRLKEAAEHAEEDYVITRENEKKRSRIETELQNLKDSRDIINERMIPAVERHTRQVNDKEWRGGLFGFIGFLLVGRKDVQKFEEVTDSAAHDEALEKQRKALSEKDAEIETQKSLLEKYGDEDSSLKELEQIRANAKVNEKEEELSKELKKQDEEIQKKYKKEIRKCKNTLRNFCDNVVDELISQVRSELRNSETSYINILVELIEANVRGEIEDKQTRMERLLEQIKSSESDKKARIEEIDAKLVVIEKIMDKAVNIQAEIENEKVDKIKTEAI